MTVPDQSTPPGQSEWLRRSRAMVVERIGLKATALLMSVLLWFVVRVVRAAGAAP